MSNTVKVVTCRNESSELIGISPNNSDYGFIRIESTDMAQIGAGGWINTNKRSTLIKGKISDLTSWVKSNSIKVGTEFAGKIVVKEQAGTPFYEGQQPKRAGADGEILHKDGMPIFRQTEFTLDMTAHDVLVKHDNVLSAAARQISTNDITMK
jgi:hypothetical protein